MGPGISAVQGDVDRHVAEQADALTGGCFPELFPLAPEQELRNPGAFDLVTVFLPGFLQGIRVPANEPPFPFGPGALAMPGLQNSEQGVIIEPVLRMLMQELFVIRAETVGWTAQESLRGFPKKPALDRYQAAVVHKLMRQTVQWIEVSLIQQPLFYQRRQTNQVGVASKGRKGLVGRIAKSCRPGGQKLPYAQLHSRQVVEECQRIVCDIANSVLAGQGTDMNPDSGLFLDNRTVHLLFSFEEHAPGPRRHLEAAGFVERNRISA